MTRIPFRLFAALPCILAGALVAAWHGRGLAQQAKTAEPPPRATPKGWVEPQVEPEAYAKLLEHAKKFNIPLAICYGGQFSDQKATAAVGRWQNHPQLAMFLKVWVRSTDNRPNELRAGKEALDTETPDPEDALSKKKPEGVLLPRLYLVGWDGAPLAAIPRSGGSDAVIGGKVQQALKRNGAVIAPTQEKLLLGVIDKAGKLVEKEKLKDALTVMKDIRRWQTAGFKGTLLEGAEPLTDYFEKAGDDKIAEALKLDKPAAKRELAKVVALFDGYKTARKATNEIRKLDGKEPLPDEDEKTAKKDVKKDDKAAKVDDKAKKDAEKKDAEKKADDKKDAEKKEAEKKEDKKDEKKSEENKDVNDEKKDEKKDAPAGPKKAALKYPAAAKFLAKLTGAEIKEIPTSDTGLQWIDTKEGDGKALKAGDTVQMHYTGWLVDGAKFDSSRDRNETFPVTLGARRVIPGWEEGLLGLKIGGKRILIIPPNLAYGDRGVGGIIPPKAVLIFEVEAVK